MGKIDFFEVNKFQNYTWGGPRYYAYPDGEDLPGKLKYALTVSTATSLIVGGAATMAVPVVPKSLKGKLFRTAQYVVPCVGAALTFTFATYFTTKFRGKDDEVNYVIGGFLSGASLAALSPIRDLGLICAFIFPALGFYRKRRQMEGKNNWFPQVQYRHFPSYYLRNLDFSLIKERPGNWTRDPEPKS